MEVPTILTIVCRVDFFKDCPVPVSAAKWIIKLGFTLLNKVSQRVGSVISPITKSTPELKPKAGSYTTIQEAGEIIAQIYGAPLPQVTGEYRHGDVRHAWADPALAQKYLDFQAKVTFTEGIKQLARWMDSLAESNGVGR